MEIFGLIMLALIAIVLQHLSNWFFRLAADEEGDTFVTLGVIIFFISCAIFLSCADYLITNF